MPGMPGEEEEQPANKSAVDESQLLECSNTLEKNQCLHSKTIAMAINIMRRWWYPRNGINLLMRNPNDTFAISPVLRLPQAALDWVVLLNAIVRGM